MRGLAVVMHTLGASMSSVVLAQGTPQSPITPVQAPSPGSGKPANLCQELLAFVRQPDPALKADAQTAQLATAVQAPKKGSEEAKPSATAGTPQQTSGQAGQVANAGPGAAGPQGTSQNAAAPSGATANVAPNPQSPPTPQGQPAAPQAAQAQPAAAPAPSAPKPTPEAVQQVEAAATSNDLQGCRAAAQKMRRAGVAMPAPLIALSALDPKLLEGAQRP